MPPAIDYRNRLSARGAQVAHLTNVLTNFGTARLTVGALILTAAGFSFFAGVFHPAWLLLGVAGFAVLVLAHQRARRSHARAIRAADFYRRGLDRIEDHWTGTGQQGLQFDDPHHVYAADLDLFGRGSLFELLCGARTRMGEERLAEWLKGPAPLEVIRDRQASITDLRDRVDLREELAVLGEHGNVGIHPAELLKWVETANELLSPWILRVAVLLPVLALGCVAFWAVSGIGTPLYLVLLLEVAILVALRPSVDRALQGSETAFEDLRLFSELLLRVERERFTAPSLQALLARLSSTSSARSS